MQLPFTTEEFLNVFKTYNESVFPLQIFFNIAALTCIYLIFKSKSKFINGILAFLWLWIGIVYHVGFFTSINKAAYIFGIVFILQGLIFLYFGVIKNGINYSYKRTFPNYVGIVFFFYALIIYPLLGMYFGHAYPYSPTFGLPCPTTIFTFGVLLFTTHKAKIIYFIIPLLWSFLGFSAALNLSIYEDFGLLISGLTGSILLLYQNRKRIKTLKAA